MRVLILSVTTGYGHHSTALALSQALEARGVEVTTADLYQQASRFMYEIMDKGYNFSIKHMRRPFRTAYNSMEENEHVRKVVSILAGNKRIAKRFSSFFKDYRPDVVVATHVLAAQALDILKAYGFLTEPVFGIVTDYCFHPFWEDVKHIEYIITGSELLSHVAGRRGIDRKKLLPLGLPVKPEFRNKRSRTEARLELGLADKRTILIMGGSMGYGNMMQAVTDIDNMDMDLQIVCICGNNEKLRQRLHYVRTKARLTILGFIDNVDIYMDAADCIITKPGGLTVTEVLCKKLPIILTEPIPGHEEHNAEFLMNCGAAIRVTENFSVSEAVFYLFSKPERLALMERALELVAHPDAAERICDVLFEAHESRQELK